MRSVALSEVKDHLSEFVAAAEAGEEVVITRHGRPAAKLTAITPAVSDRQAAKLAAIAALKLHREKMRAAGMTATREELIAWKNEGRS
jgi:prevent-host-death family protein